jgi:SAM-dependent methyltransferase
MKDTKSNWYTARLMREQTALWKRLLGVQAPYRWNLERLGPGRTLDLGCGVGRNLRLLSGDSVGVDHSAAAVAACRALGLQAFTPEDFPHQACAGHASFDSLLCAHVLEHMSLQAAIACVGGYVRYLKPRSRIILISPQESGFRSDPTHVEFMPAEKLVHVLQYHGFTASRSYSFPFPRWAGQYFRYNEFVVVGERILRITQSAALPPG